MTAAPLAGLRVLDFTWVGAGPIGTKILAEFGAEVIKIESATRPDPLRRTAPFAPGDAPLERSGYFADRNAGKRSVALDMSHPRAREVVLRLAARSDVCTQSFRPGTMEKWRLGYEDLITVRPDLIYLAMPMQGESGPHATFSGFGATLVALCGLHELCGYPDREPVGTGTNYPDHVPNPMHAVVAILAAVLHRDATGDGQRIELSQLESTLNVIGPAIEMADTGRTPHRSGNRIPHAAPHGVFPTRGHDRWIAISVMDDERWAAFTAICDLPALRVPDYARLAGRKAHEDEIERAIAAWTADRDADELAAALVAARIAASPVRTADELLDDVGGLVSAGAVQWLDHPVMGKSVYTAPTPHLTRTPGSLAGPAPLLGADTDEVLREIGGLDPDEILDLRAAGVLT